MNDIEPNISDALGADMKRSPSRKKATPESNKELNKILRGLKAMYVDSDAVDGTEAEPIYNFDNAEKAIEAWGMRQRLDELRQLVADKDLGHNNVTFIIKRLEAIRASLGVDRGTK